MQCKDIPDLPIIAMAYAEWEKNHDWPKWLNWYFGNDRDVGRAMPANTPDKVKLAKMRRLIQRGLIEGCGCGCRGDFVITARGREWYEAQKSTGNGRKFESVIPTTGDGSQVNAS